MLSDENTRVNKCLCRSNFTQPNQGFNNQNKTPTTISLNTNPLNISPIMQTIMIFVLSSKHKKTLNFPLSPNQSLMKSILSTAPMQAYAHDSRFVEFSSIYGHCNHCSSMQNQLIYSHNSNKLPNLPYVLIGLKLIQFLWRFHE